MQAQTYIVRLYRTSRAIRLAGTVEVVEGGRTVAFRGLRQLHAILRQGDGVRPIGIGQRSRRRS